MDLKAKIRESTEYILRTATIKPEIGLILGSGLAGLADELTGAEVIPYKNIPHFPLSTVTGHPGELALGRLEGKPVVTLKGRFHYYEGYTMDEVTFPVRVMKALGVLTLIITNAAGGLNRSFNRGDLMLITDHINFMGTNPLIGPNDDELGPRFPEMSEAYDSKLIELAEQTAATEGVELKRGVYIAVTGPTYETPAEIALMQHMGADAVGMSTVPEVIVARHAGLRVLGISCITDVAFGLHQEKVEHEKVLATARKASAKFAKLIKAILRHLE